MRRLIYGAAACLTLAACADSTTDPTAGISLAKVPTTTPSACPAGTTGAEGALPGSGALYLICVPPGFDASSGSLVVYAPGSVFPQEPLAIRDDELGGTRVSVIVTGLGLAFATTSYRAKGLVVRDGTQDLQRLVALFGELYGPLGGAVYGVGAASQRYFKKSPARLSRKESALLAAVLPNPKRFRVDRPSKYVQRRAWWIERQMIRLGPGALVPVS